MLRCLLVASGDCTQLPNHDEEVVDQMKRCIKLSVIAARRGLVLSWRDHHCLASRGQWL